MKDYLPLKLKLSEGKIYKYIMDMSGYNNVNLLSLLLILVVASYSFLFNFLES